MRLNNLLEVTRPVKDTVWGWEQLHGVPHWCTPKDTASGTYEVPPSARDPRTAKSI